VTKQILSTAAKALGLASSGTSAALVRPALTAVFALVAVVNYLVFPTVGVEAAELPKFFWYTLWGLTGLYSSLRTGEKIKGTAPDKEEDQSQVRFDSQHVQNMIHQAVQTERAREKFNPPTPEVQSDPDEEDRSEAEPDGVEPEVEDGPVKANPAPPEEL
jgi:hypothetical protein